MVISDELEFVFLGIPRTANRAMHLALLQLPGAFKHGLLHEMRIPKRCQTYFTFCCVRNPYRRFLAYYLWRKMPHPWGCEADGMSFEDYIDAMEQGDLGPRTVREHLESNLLDHAIRYEELPASFYELSPIKGIEAVELRKGGKRLSRHWKHYYDRRLADRVYAMTRPDFDEFGYDRDSWKE